jgi:hypothetical protein
LPERGNRASAAEVLLPRERTLVAGLVMAAATLRLVRLSIRRVQF